MELRCDCRSTNISETSRFEYSISYILRLIAISSTENAQCGVLPLVRNVSSSIRSNHVALPTNDHSERSILLNIFSDRACAGAGAKPAPDWGCGGRCRQQPGRTMQWQHVGR